MCRSKLEIPSIIRPRHPSPPRTTIMASEGVMIKSVQKMNKSEASGGNPLLGRDTSGILEHGRASSPSARTDGPRRGGAVLGSQEALPSSAADCDPQQAEAPQGGPCALPRGRPAVAGEPQRDHVPDGSKRRWTTCTRMWKAQGAMLWVLVAMRP